MKLFKRPAALPRNEERALVQLWQEFANEATPVPHSLTEYVESGYKAASPVFACILVRMQLVSQARWYWRDFYTHDRMRSKLDLELLRNPWPNGSASELAVRMEQDASLAGNCFLYRPKNRDGQPGNRIQRLRPDWVDFLVAQSKDDPQVTDLLSYLYTPGGRMGDRSQRVVLDPMDVAHYAPIPDPLHPVRGMSWLTAVARQVNNSVDMTDFHSAFFANAATPNMLVKVMGKLEVDQRKRLEEVLERRHTGSSNAYRTLLLEGGADATIIGADLRQIQFTMLKAATDNDIATAAGVPAILAGLKEGLQAATYSNAAQARRVYAMGSGKMLLQSMGDALQSILRQPNRDAELTFDERKMAWFQEDATEAATIVQQKAATMLTLINAGYAQDDIAAAVESGDLSKLDHSGLFSVQLQPPGTELVNAESNGSGTMKELVL